jgi:hypothetical protein
MERRPVRCAVYTRQSVARPNDTDFTSCEAQREVCHAFIRAHAPEGWVALYEPFDDAGESAATIDRPALERLLGRIASGRVDRVVVQRLDRLTRSVSDWAKLVGAFKRRGTELSIVAGDMHLLSHQLVVQPDQAHVVKRMFEMAATGAPASAIAAWINVQREDNRRALDGRRRWSAKAVLRVLSNPVYLGRMGAVADAHDAVVEEPLFAKARAAVDARRTRVPGRRPPRDGDLFLLRRMLRCVLCERLMTTSSSRALPEASTGPRPSRVASPSRYYRCRGQRSCRGSQVAAEDIERRVLAWLRRPTGGISIEAKAVLTSYAPIWKVLFPATVRRSVAQLVWEVRWDGPHDRFTVVLDETAIAEAYASIERREDERANLPRPRGRMRGRLRSR